MKDARQDADVTLSLSVQVPVHSNNILSSKTPTGINKDCVIITLINKHRPDNNISPLLLNTFINCGVRIGY